MGMQVVSIELKMHLNPSRSYIDMYAHLLGSEGLLKVTISK